MIAGIISGGAVALMWFISALVYLHKRRERTKRAHAAGVHRRDLPPRRMPHAEYMIPPDPAYVAPDTPSHDGPDAAESVKSGGDARESRVQSTDGAVPGRARTTSPRPGSPTTLHHRTQYDPSHGG